jgi:transcriptional regulator with XRE-family HTH domain
MTRRDKPDYRPAAEVREHDHLSLEDAAAKLGVRPSYVARIRSRGDRPGRRATVTILRLDLPVELHDQVRQYAAGLAQARKQARKRVA